VLGAVAVQVTPHLVQLEAVAGGQRQHDRVFAGRRLQLEVEGAAETLAQARPQARLMRLPNGEWMISWVPPDSSKNRSISSVSCEGRAPRVWRARAR
jgi:hypothetical protein